MKKVFATSSIVIPLFIICGFLLINSVNAQIIVIPPAPIITTSSQLQTISVNQPHSLQFEVNGGTSPYSWSHISGSLPSGLSLDSSGLMSGTPTSMGTFNFGVEVTDTNLETAAKNFSVVIGNESTTGFVYTRTPVANTVAEPLTIRVQGVFGIDFCASPKSTYYWVKYFEQETNDQSNSGLFYHAQGEVIDDTFMFDLGVGTYDHAEIICDTQGEGYYSYSNVDQILNASGFLTKVYPIPTITTANQLSTRSVNQSYSQQLEASGGLLPYAWNIVSGSLPDGLSLDSSTGLIFGTPTVMGTFNFTIRVATSNLETGTKNFSVIIGNESTTGFVYTRIPLANIVAEPLTIRVQGVFGIDICTNPGSTYYWVKYYERETNDQANSGHFSHAQGEVVDETFLFDLNVGTYDHAEIICDRPDGAYDVFGGVDQILNASGFLTKVYPIPTILTPDLLVTSGVNQLYSLQLQADGGVSPYSWSLVSGSLPFGLSLDSSGLIYGTPTSMGTYSFNVQVTDYNLQIAVKSFTVVIGNQSTTGLLYTRTPEGSVVVSPLTIRVQGVFGIDFCSNPGSTYYWVKYSNAETNAQANSGQFLHSQGEVVDDTFILYLSVGTYDLAEIICDRPDGGYYAYSVDFGLSVPAIVVSTFSLVDGSVGISYNEILQATNGALPLNWSITNGSLPSGLSINSSTGEISGIPTSVETANFTVRVIDANNNVATKDLSIIVHGNTTTTLQSSADTYLKQGTPNSSQGSDTFLRLQQSGKNRSLIQFDPQTIINAIGSGTLVSAILETDIQDNGNNWGASGRTIDVHRMTRDWTELGATWNCANDTNTANASPNCPGDTWNMNAEDSFASTPTDTETITNGLTGTVSFNVTSDIQSFLNNTTQHQGWIVKKTNENQSGQIDFDSRETSNDPRLVLVIFN